MEILKKKIGVDLDDVLLNFNDALHAYHNAKYGTSVKRADITSYGIENVWHCTPEEALRRVFEFYSTPEHDFASPVSGAAEALAKLRDSYEFHIISSRGDQIRELTEKWLHSNFPGNFASINLTNQYFGLPEKLCLKSDICKRIGIHVMVEDSLSQVKDVAQICKTVYLLDCPWNQGVLPANVVRVYSWSDIANALA